MVPFQKQVQDLALPGLFCVLKCTEQCGCIGAVQFVYRGARVEQSFDLLNKPKRSKQA